MATVAGVVARTDFQTRLLASLKAKGVAVESILRMYQPLEEGENIECLILDIKRGALTVWANPAGEIVSGPVEGFGPERGLT